MFLFWPGCYYTWRASQHRDPTWGYFVVWVPLPWREGWLFWVPTHAPKPLVTRFESVSTFLSYPAPGYPWAWPSHESYLSQGPLWGDMGTSRVRLLSTGVSTMALKPPFSSLYCYPRLSGFEAFPWRHSLHGLSYPWVSGSNAVDALLWGHFTLATPYLGDALTWQRLIWATLPLGDACSWRRLT